MVSKQKSGSDAAHGRVSEAQRRWLMRGINQAGGKLPLFDGEGQRISDKTVKSCLDKGWAEPWFVNPIKPDWVVCKLTEEGRALVSEDAP